MQAFIDQLTTSLHNELSPLGFELEPFLVHWYEKYVEDRLKLDISDKNAVCFCITSNPLMFEKCFMPFARELAAKHQLTDSQLDELKKSHKDLKFASVVNDLLDWSAYYTLKSKLDKVVNELIERPETHSEAIRLLASADCIPDFAMKVGNMLPEVHVQTAGHVSGMAYFYRPDGTDCRYGASLHPIYGGWFLFRGIFVFPNLSCPDLPAKVPIKTLKNDEEKQNFLRDYNGEWRNNKWRYHGRQDGAPIYSSDAIKYVNTNPKNRMKVLQDILIE